MPLRIVCYAVVLVLASIMLIAKSSARQNVTSGEYIPPQWSADATLRDIYFLNSEVGIAVGDQGTVLRTTDGGRRWQLVFVSNDCSLCSISFADESNGWIAGGYAQPLVDRTRGVILLTNDGGQTWRESTGTVLPAIAQIQFVNPQLGWARCHASQYYPNGFCTTSDGGKSWSTASLAAPGMATAAERGRRGFIVADRDGLGVVTGNQILPANVAGGPPGEIHAIAMRDLEFGIAVSDHQVWSTEDGGSNWQVVPAPPETSGSDVSRWTTAFVHEQSAWIAGDPGSFIAHWNLETHQWTRVRTPVRACIHKIFFLDGQRGWAVGELGTILSTRDGGLHWQKQRSAGDRLALLFVCRSARDVPYELLARHAGEQGYLAGVVVFEPELACDYSDPILRIEQAVGRVGGSLVVAAPVANSNAAIDRLIGIIRRTQPTTIVICQSPEESSSRGLDIPSAVVSAVELAASTTLDRDRAQRSGLDAWQTPKVLLCQAQRDAPSGWGSAEMLVKIGRTLTDFVFISRCLIGESECSGWTFNLSSLGGLPSNRLNDLFDGTFNSLTQPPQREPIQPQGHIGHVKSMSNKFETLNGLLGKFRGEPDALRVWDQRINQMLGELPIDVAGVWLWQLGQAYWRNDKLELAAWARAKIASACPNHPLAAAARIWLVHYYCSDELTQQAFANNDPQTQTVQTIQDPAVRPAGLRTVVEEIELDGVKHYVWSADVESKKQPGSDPRSTPGPPSRANPDLASFRLERQRVAQRILQSIGLIDPDLAADPELEWLSAGLARRLEGPPAAEAILKRLPKDGVAPSLLELVNRERLLLAAQGGRDIGPEIRCLPVEERPYLDGKLDDAAWRLSAQQDTIARLLPRSDNPSSPLMRNASDPRLGTTQAMFAHDAEYLYVAIICQKEPGRPSNRHARQRDQELSDDVVAIRIDADRDGLSYFVFEFDQFGDFGDRLGSDRMWNPEWHYAFAESENTWTIEAAIPFRSLALLDGADPDSAEWIIEICRYLPRRDVEFWGASFPQGRWAAKREFELAPAGGVLRFR